MIEAHPRHLGSLLHTGKSLLRHDSRVLEHTPSRGGIKYERGCQPKNFPRKRCQNYKNLGKTAQNWKFAPSSFSFLSEDPPPKN